MGLISKEVEVGLRFNEIEYYENLGYEIPKVLASEATYKRYKKRYVVKQGTKILVKVEDLPKGSRIKVNVKCDCCDKEYLTQYNIYYTHNHNGKVYCNKCSNTVLCSGENNPRWNSNITDEEREIDRCYPEYTEFVKKVLSRDNYTCKCCGNSESNNMEVHHLDGYDWCVDKRTDETNGITLCKACHKNFHIKYGCGENTREQFEEWIGHAIGELDKYNGELPTARKVYCIEEDKIYDSAEQLAEELNIKYNSQIYDVCNHKKRKKGYNKSVQGKHLLWLDEYEKCTEEDIQRFLEWCKPKSNNYKISGKNNPNAKQVICITTGKIFDTVTEASRYYNCCNTSICQCCTGKRNYCGKLEDGTKLQWKYYEDYLK